MPDDETDEMVESARRPDWKPADLAAQTRRTGDALDRERARPERRRKQRRRVAASARPKSCSEPRHLRGDDVIALVKRVRASIARGHSDRSDLIELCDTVERLVGEEARERANAVQKGANNVEAKSCAAARR